MDFLKLTFQHLKKLKVCFSYLKKKSFMIFEYFPLIKTTLTITVIQRKKDDDKKKSKNWKIDINRNVYVNNTVVDNILYNNSNVY